MIGLSIELLYIGFSVLALIEKWYGLLFVLSVLFYLIKTGGV